MIPVYAAEDSEEIVARVKYNSKLDVWNGNNYQNGGVGMHKGITRLKDGSFVIIIGSQWQGSRDYGYVVSDKEALQEAIKGKLNDDDMKRWFGKMLKEMDNQEE